MSEHGVIIAGGGPTGMTLAAELALGGADVAIVERRQTRSLGGLAKARISRVGLAGVRSTLAATNPCYV